MSHFQGGLEHGLAVGWYDDGRVMVCNEMVEGVCHGWHREWAADGTLQVEEFCVLGRPQRG